MSDKKPPAPIKVAKDSNIPAFRADDSAPIPNYKIPSPSPIKSQQATPPPKDK